MRTQSFKIVPLETSSQHGGIGRYSLLPCTTQRRLTTSLKTKNNQNCQKIELCGSPTTKVLNTKYSSRLVGGAETDSWGTEDVQQDGGWQSGQSHIRLWINQEEQLGSETDHATQGSSAGQIKPQTSGCKNLWGLQQQEKLPVS